MSKDSYEVHPVKLETVEGFEVLILALPESELNDKLTYLTREKGKISRSFYEDFIIANCVGNINQLLSYITQNSADSADLLTIREELMSKILEFNPLLKPDNLVINKLHQLYRQNFLLLGLFLQQFPTLNHHLLLCILIVLFLINVLFFLIYHLTINLNLFR